ncbi:hypothetical protein D3C80_1137550 [compost metagenome]
MLIAAAFDDVIGKMNNVASGMAVAAKQLFERMIQQIRRMNVDLHHAGERFAKRSARFFSLPCAGIMNDGAQSAGVGLHRFGKSQNPFVSRKIGLNAGGTCLA